MTASNAEQDMSALVVGKARDRPDDRGCYSVIELTFDYVGLARIDQPLALLSNEHSFNVFGVGRGMRPCLDSEQIAQWYGNGYCAAQ